MDNKLGLSSLTAIVIGSMIGAGVFSLPQNMASVASPAAVMIGWTITGIGMIFLALSFQKLAFHRPEVDSGVFGYAKRGLVISSDSALRGVIGSVPCSQTSLTW